MLHTTSAWIVAQGVDSLVNPGTPRTRWVVCLMSRECPHSFYFMQNLEEIIDIATAKLTHEETAAITKIANEADLLHTQTPVYR